MKLPSPSKHDSTAVAAASPCCPLLGTISPWELSRELWLTPVIDAPAASVQPQDRGKVLLCKEASHSQWNEPVGRPLWRPASLMWSITNVKHKGEFPYVDCIVIQHDIIASKYWSSLCFGLWFVEVMQLIQEGARRGWCCPTCSV